MQDQFVLKTPLISISPTGAYVVSFSEQVFPRVHVVKSIEEKWLCDCGANCEALRAVQSYLENGGRRAPEPLPACPICGSGCVPDPKSFGTQRDPAWCCLQGGHEHQVLARARRLAEGFKKHPWLFPPVLDAQGNVCHEGVRRTDVVTFEEAAVVNLQIFQTSGYNPVQ